MNDAEYRRLVKLLTVRACRALKLTVSKGEDWILAEGKSPADYAAETLILWGTNNLQFTGTPDKLMPFLTRVTTEAIVTEGTEKGEMRRVCANPDCPIHHPKNKQQARAKENIAAKAEQEKRRREETLAQAIALRTFRAIGDAVPVRLMRRDLAFMAERLTTLLDERKLALLIRQHGIGKTKGEAPAKLLAAFLRKADEGILGRVLTESVVLLSMRSAGDSDRVLREAASLYKVDVDTIAAKAKQEFAAKQKPKPAQKAAPAKAAKKASAA